MIRAALTNGHSFATMVHPFPFPFVAVNVEPSSDDIEDLLDLLPRLRELEGEYVTGWAAARSGDRTAAHSPIYPRAVTEFFYVASQPCWRDDPHDAKAAEALARDRARVSRASLREVRAMLTWCVRGERVREGHWCAVLEDGTVFAILARLQELADAGI
ncbi:MAG TPA: DUF6508 domain-containing protein [Usitatibacter sp.]|nr:DUF6508 domain-containing protein [Usitatibacter sp.]